MSDGSLSLRSDVALSLLGRQPDDMVDLAHAPGPVAVLLVNPQPVFRHGVELVLRHLPPFRVCASVADGHEALDAVRLHRPAITLVDLDLTEEDALVLVRRLVAAPCGTKVIGLTDQVLAREVDPVFAAGAVGLVLKGEVAGALPRALREVFAGGVFLDPPGPGSVRSGGAETVRRRVPTAEAVRAVLSPREAELLDLLGSGLRLVLAAERMGVSRKTAETHRDAIRHKLALRDAAEVAELAGRLSAAALQDKLFASTPAGSRRTVAVDADRPLAK